MFVTERWSDRRFHQSPVTAQGITWTGTRGFDVVGAPNEIIAADAEDANWDPMYGDNGSAVPGWYSKHPVYPFMRAVERDVQRRGFNVHRVLINYVAKNVPAGVLENRPIEVTWDPQSYTEMVDRDVYGNPLVNSYGDPFEPRSREFTELNARIVRIEPGYDLPFALAYQGSVNQDDFNLLNQLPVRAGECKFMSMRPVGPISLIDTTSNQGFPIEYHLKIRQLLSEPDQDNPGISSFDWRIMDQGSHGFYYKQTRKAATGNPTYTLSPSGDYQLVGGELVHLDRAPANDVRLDGYGKPLKDWYRIDSSAMFTPVRGRTQDVDDSQNPPMRNIPFGPPSGATLDLRHQNDAVFMVYSKCKRQAFAGLIDVPFVDF